MDGSGRLFGLSCLPHFNSQRAACPDCPASRLETFEDWISDQTPACVLETFNLRARERTPDAWGQRFAFGMVRRGVIIRERTSLRDDAVAIDALGPGCLFPLEIPELLPTMSGYAATNAIVCLCRRELVEEAFRTGAPAARDLYDGLQTTMLRVERLAQARGAATVRKKVASLLCVLSDCLSPPRRRTRLPPGLQQRDLARLLGVRHETFCRVLGELERAGLIRRDPDGLELINRDQLALA